MSVSSSSLNRECERRDSRAFVGNAKTITLDEPAAGVERFENYWWNWGEVERFFSVVISHRRSRYSRWSNCHHFQSVFFILSFSLSLWHSRWSIETLWDAVVSENNVWWRLSVDINEKGSLDKFRRFNNVCPQLISKKKNPSNENLSSSLRSRSILFFRLEVFNLFFYGFQDLSLDEVFLKVTERFKASPTATNVENEVASEEQSMTTTTTKQLDPIERRVTGVRLYAK